jgi:hypothetical protein
VTARLVVAVALLALSTGCSRWYTRRDRERLVPAPAPPVPTVPVSAPAPPPPPPEPPPPSVPLPSADAVMGGIVPPLPGTAGPVEPPDLTPASATEGDGPLRARLEELRRRREERRNPPDQRPTLPQTLPPPSTIAPPQVQSPGDTTARGLIDAAVRRWAEVPGFEARIVKREVVGGKPTPQNEAVYRFRKQPMSVYLKVTAGPGEGREVLYVQGRHGDKVHVVTGQGDNKLVGPGFKTTLDPTDRQLTAKSRYRITDAGFGRVLTGLNAPGAAVKALGLVKRQEHSLPMPGVEQTLKPGDDPLLPRGGVRQVFFDPDPKSAGYRLPVLTITTEPDGREAEYYSLDRFAVPGRLADEEWTPDRLGRR